MIRSNKTEKKEANRRINRVADIMQFTNELSEGNVVAKIRGFSKAKLLNYIDLVMSGDIYVIVPPATKKEIELWNEKAKEAGRTDLILDVEKTLQESKYKEATYIADQEAEKKYWKNLKQGAKIAKKYNKKNLKDQVKKEETVVEEKVFDNHKKENDSENIIEGDSFILYMNESCLEKYPEAYGYLDDIEITNELQVAENQMMISDSHIKDSTELEAVGDCNIQCEEGEIVKDSGIRIEYNPFKVETKIFLGNSDIVNGPTQFRGIRERRLQEWTEVLNESWQGIFNELKKVTGMKELTIYFIGTVMDFDDLEKARKKFINNNDDCSITLIHANKETADSVDPSIKINELRDAFEKLKSGPIEELKQEKIVNEFNKALNNEFKITIIAPMSSGKSTLLNAFIGKDLLPALNQATTAVITEIKDDETKKDFILTNVEPKNDTILKNTEVDNKKIKELNDAIDPNDSQKKRARYKKIRIEGPISGISSDNMNVVFVDTPGGNNSQNYEHRILMDEAIGDSDELVLFVFDGRKLTANDSKEILTKIASAMKTHVGSQFRDRFLFVINCMDDYDIENESYESVVESVKKMLNEIDAEGFDNARLFLVSAEACKLARIKKTNMQLSKNQENRYNSLLSKFSESERILTRYASLNDSDKEKLISEAEDTINKVKITEESLSLIEGRIQEFEENESEVDTTEYLKLQKQKRSLKKELEKLQLWCVEYNSGIPAVECAINEYIKKFAICIKIKSLHDTFMKNVSIKNNIYNFEKVLSESEEARKRLEDDLSKIYENKERNEKLLELKNRINTITVDADPNYYLYDLMKVFVDLEKGGVKKELSKEEARIRYDAFMTEIEKCNKSMETGINNYFTELEKSLSNISDELQNYLENHINSIHFGESNLGDYLDDINLETFKFKKGIYLGTKKKKKLGIRAAIASLFGGGFEEIKQYENKEYVRWEDFVMTVTKKKMELKKQVTEIFNDGWGELEEYKKQVCDELDDIEYKLSNILNEYTIKLNDKEKLTQEIEKNKEKYNWLLSYKKEVDSFMRIGDV